MLIRRQERLMYRVIIACAHQHTSSPGTTPRRMALADVAAASEASLINQRAIVSIDADSRADTASVARQRRVISSCGRPKRRQAASFIFLYRLRSWRRRYFSRAARQRRLEWQMSSRPPGRPRPIEYALVISAIKKMAAIGRNVLRLRRLLTPGLSLESKSSSTLVFIIARFWLAAAIAAPAFVSSPARAATTRAWRRRPSLSSSGALRSRSRPSAYWPSRRRRHVAAA